MTDYTKNIKYFQSFDEAVTEALASGLEEVWETGLSVPGRWAVGSVPQELANEWEERENEYEEGWGRMNVAELVAIGGHYYHTSTIKTRE